MNIYKSERVLNGLSVTYSKYSRIDIDLLAIFNWAILIDWTYENPQLPSNFTKFMTDIWRVHPYREGNTRAVSIFMKLFADKQDLPFNAKLLSQNVGYLRNALVMAAIDETPEYSYLHRIITDALSLVNPIEAELSEEKQQSYQTIRQYDVTNYEEKPFDTNKDK